MVSGQFDRKLLAAGTTLLSEASVSVDLPTKADELGPDDAEGSGGRGCVATGLSSVDKSTFALPEIIIMVTNTLHHYT